MIRIYFLLLAILFPIGLGAQQNTHYQPIKFLKEISSEKSSKIKSRYQIDLEAAKSTKSYGSDLSEVYTSRFEYLQKQIEEGKYISGSKLNSYCEKVLNHILEANPYLNGVEINLLVSRSPAPNASCLGEGTIVVNIGLIRRLETESQLAFVLCHELAHYFQNHVDNAIHQKLVELNSKETKKKIKNISRSKYGKTLQALDLLKDMSYQSSRHSRIKETEADEIGLSYLLKTKYNPFGALTALSILNSIDEEKYPQELSLKQVFGSLKYKADDNWFAYASDNAFSYGGGNGLGWDADSLKSHPDCDNRIAALGIKLEAVKPKTDFVVSETTFNQIKVVCDYEMVESAWRFKDYGSALYHSLILLRVYPNDAYLHGMVGNCMAYLFEYQKNHELNKVLELPDHRFGENYHRLLKFIHNLRLKDMGALGYYYLQPLKEKFGKNEDFLFGYLYTCYTSGNLEEGNQALQIYLNQYPEGRFLEAIEEISTIYK